MIEILVVSNVLLLIYVYVNERDKKGTGDELTALYTELERLDADIEQLYKENQDTIYIELDEI